MTNDLSYLPWRALHRILTGKNGWTKTARTIEAVEAPGTLVPAAAHDVQGRLG